MYELIQALPHNEYFILALIAVFAWIWINPPKTVFWKKHVAAYFDETCSKQHPACFMCNQGNESCYRDWHACKAWRDQHQDYVLKVAAEDDK